MLSEVALPPAPVRLRDAAGLRPATSPAALLELAWACEAGLLLTDRTAALDAIPVGDQRWRRRVDAERAIDLARLVRLDEAEALAQAVLSDPASDEVALARATAALGSARAWRGDAHSAREAGRLLTDAAVAYGRLGALDWQGHVLFWRGNTVHLQRGEVDEADAYLRQSLLLLDSSSLLRPTVLTFFADLLAYRGQFDEATAALDEAAELARRPEDRQVWSYVSWSRMRIRSMRGDAAGTRREVVETLRHGGDWFGTHIGTTFLADAAECLDRVGDQVAADERLAEARARHPDDEFVLQAQAALLARRGDPDAALEALRRMDDAPWLEHRLRWRTTLFTAYATVRARGAGAGELAARALELAADGGGVVVAQVGEPAVIEALLPIAARAGSAYARELLAPGDTRILRLLGDVRLTLHGEKVSIPQGNPGALLRLLGMHPAGLPADEIVELLWPEADPIAGRKQLRDVLARLRSRTGPIVVRDGVRLRLVGVWVDATAFRSSADRALAERSVAQAVASLALWGGTPLPSDPYTSWALPLREQFRRRHLGLLDLIADDAANRGSYDEAARILGEAIEEDPYDESRYLRAGTHLLAAGRRAAALRLARQGAASLATLGLEPDAGLAQLLEAARHG
jgi:DNA-binding SARP family transcriptional activator